MTISGIINQLFKNKKVNHLDGQITLRLYQPELTFCNFAGAHIKSLMVTRWYEFFNTSQKEWSL